MPDLVTGVKDGDAGAPYEDERMSVTSSSPSMAVLKDLDTEIEQRFRPRAGVDYAKPFARAVLSAYDSGVLGDAWQKDRRLAERVLRGEGRDLVFRKSYVHKTREGTWNGTDRMPRRSAFIHILGVDSAACSAEDCMYAGKSCETCRTATGWIIGCRHSHEILKSQACSNCGSKPATCSSHVGLKRRSEYVEEDDAAIEDETSIDYGAGIGYQSDGTTQPRSATTRQRRKVDYREDEIGVDDETFLTQLQSATHHQPAATRHHPAITNRQPAAEAPARSTSSPGVPGDSNGLEDGLPMQGPFFNRIVQKAVDRHLRPRDVSKSMRHEMVDQEDHVIHADWLWVKHYKLLLENEMRARRIDFAEGVES